VSWWNKIFGKPGPKANVVTPLGNHIENLAAHPEVNLKADKVHEPTGMPVWADIAPDRPTNLTFDNMLWEIEPMGEYIYYLAGNFPKNEKGLLRYASATMQAEVFVSYEDDVINVAKIDEAQYSQYSKETAQDHTDFADMTIGDIYALNNERTESSGIDYSFIMLRDKRANIGWSYLRCGSTPRPSLKIACTILDESRALPRLTSIIVRSSDLDQKLGPLSDYALELIERYRAISHHELTGAIRM